MIEEMNPAAVVLGKLEGSKGCRTHTAKLTHQQRSAMAKKAAEAWLAKRRQQDEAS
jgi:hypothetical protein